MSKIADMIDLVADAHLGVDIPIFYHLKLFLSYTI